MNGIHYTTPERQARREREAKRNRRIRKVKETAKAAALVALLFGMLTAGAWVDSGSQKANHQAQTQAATSQK